MAEMAHFRNRFLQMLGHKTSFSAPKVCWLLAPLMLDQYKPAGYDRPPTHTVKLTGLCNKPVKLC